MTTTVSLPEDSTVVRLASHGRSAVGELVFGSVTHDVIMGSTTPVLVVGPHAGFVPAFGTIQVCYDSSPPSGHALQAAAAWARQLGVTLWLTQVVEPDLDLPALVPPSDVVEGAALARVAQDLDAARVDASWDILHGTHPAEALVAWSAVHRPSVMVLGSRGRSAARRVVVGSVASRLITKATCPVLVTGPACR